MHWHNLSQWVLDLGWLFFLLVLLRHFVQDRRGLLRTRSWLKTKGHITSYELTTVGNNLWPKIEYSYQVYDKDLIGEYLFLDTAHNSPTSKYSRQIAYKAAMAYKENAEIDVFYNPNNPEQSALDITMPRKLNVIIILISSLIVLHLGIIASRVLN